jgi:2-amino-4-hydroxy-6-hydroxymethyldihydropteridine diphosphokinase
LLCYLGLGSNLGDRAGELAGALALLAAGPGIAVRRVSSIYESAALGPVPAQPRFLNAAAELASELAPRALLARCLAVEEERGRKRWRLKGPRSIDLDLLLVPGLVAVWPELVLPHPELARRAFALVPLLELAPDIVDPRSGRRLAEALPRLIAEGQLAGLRRVGDEMQAGGDD